MNFYDQYKRIINSKQSRSVVLCGNVHDLFWDGKTAAAPEKPNYVPLIDCLRSKTKSEQLIQVVYELNNPIRFDNERAIKEAYIEYKSGKKYEDLMLQRATARDKKPLVDELGEEFDKLVMESQGNSILGLQFLQQLTSCSRAKLKGKALLIFIEGADMMLPTKDDFASLNEADRRRVAIVQDWLSDPAFCNGSDSVTLIAESKSQIHSRIAKLPQLLSVEIPSPDKANRLSYIKSFLDGKEIKKDGGVWDHEELARMTAGLSIHALRQMLIGAEDEGLSTKTLVAKIESFIQSQVGEDVIEFKKPEHRLENVIGYEQLKKFIKEEMIPRFRNGGDGALVGAAIGGPIGAGKTFIFEAMSAEPELNMPVLVLKSIRSQWYGQTDVIFERLRRTLEALEKVIIFVDEADTQFGGVDSGVHETERRLTGKIQAMMSDPKLKGRVIWLLMTARINLLSPDIRRPGRAGDLIIPVLDPDGDDHKAFAKWVISKVCDENEETIAKISALTTGYSAASYASLKANLKSRNKKLDVEEIMAIIADQIPANIGPTREYQKLQALLNCTRLSLIPKSELGSDTIQAAREKWEVRIKDLELKGIK
jgi:SpoVK/Ycf46/Vps4 family AAA+-type ATPase